MKEKKKKKKEEPEKQGYKAEQEQDQTTTKRRADPNNGSALPVYRKDHTHAIERRGLATIGLASNQQLPPNTRIFQRLRRNKNENKSKTRTSVGKKRNE